jgi:diguanylate cyclase (GGDEF)-like protein
MHPVFNSYTSSPIHAKYSEMINHYIEMCVHPDDQEQLRRDVVYLDIAKKLQLKVNALQVRMRKEFLQSFCSTANAREIEALVAHSGDWIWIEVRDTCITDVATGDLLVYVDLFNVEEVVQEKTQLVVAATTDMLTNLNNRSAAEKRMREFLFNKNQDGAFFILDLDNFKLVNDRFGHPEGDKVLREVAQIIRSVFRDKDVMARLGGDEFCIYAPGMMSVETVNRCVTSLLSRCCFEYTYEDSCFAVTASIGVVFASQANYEYTTLYEYADQALYSAKTKGKNTWSLYKATD